MSERTCNVPNLLRLPLELQFRIISYLELKSQINLRKVNKDLRLLSNLYWRSELKKIVFKAETAYFRTTEDCVMQALKISTEIYVANGYETNFWNCLLAFLREKALKTLHNLTKQYFQEFLLRYYKIMDDMVYHEFPQYLRSLYVMQLLHLLKCFPTSQLSVRPSKIGLNLHVDIEDIWLGTTFELLTVDKLNFLLVALAELYYSYCFQRTSAFANVHQGYCFTYGYETVKKRKRHFRTEFDIFIESTEELKSYIEAWLCAADDFVYFPRRIFIEYFRFGLKIDVKGFVKNFWPQKILLELD